MSASSNLDLTAQCLDEFADGLVAHAARLGSLSEQTRWQSIGAVKFRERLVELRVTLRASATQAHDGAEAVRHAARAQAAAE